MTRTPHLLVKHLAGSYPVHVAAGWFAELAREIGSRGRRIVLLTDSNVDRLYGRRFCEAIGTHCRVDPVCVVPAGEESKSHYQAVRLYEQFHRSRVDRTALVAALGGGVIGDLAGFVAGTWMRGLEWVMIPTTLLAQVDSSIGGKTGVNLPQMKNAVGVFWHPSMVCIDTQLLQTLPEDEYTSGLAEVVKYGLILDAPFLEFLESHAAAIRGRDPEILAAIVRRCCELKAGVVQQDERETTGVRAILNYGHTFGHAFESVAGLGQLRHGHAVAAGMMAAARVALRMGLVDEAQISAQASLFRALGIPCEFPNADPETILEVMRHDKKSANGQLRLILPVARGQVKSVEVADPTSVLHALSHSPESH